jgi:hypothetical protein
MPLSLFSSPVFGGGYRRGKAAQELFPTYDLK